MAIELIDKIKQKNNGDFALVDATDVALSDGTRLQAFIDEGNFGGDDGTCIITIDGDLAGDISDSIIDTFLQAKNEGKFVKVQLTGTVYYGIVTGSYPYSPMFIQAIDYNKDKLKYTINPDKTTSYSKGTYVTTDELEDIVLGLIDSKLEEVENGTY